MATKASGVDKNDQEKDLEFKSRSFTEGLSENLHILSNDPSLALYRIQEHVRKSLPQLAQRRHDVTRLHQGIQGACFDIENAIIVVHSMKNAMTTFQNVYELLRSTMYYKQQLDYERLRREKARQQFAHSVSKDSIAQELRKTKSMGQIGSKNDLMSESAMSRSTVSTPCSEYPDMQIEHDDLDEDDVIKMSLALRRNTVTNEEEAEVENDEKSSTTTSGADSHVSDQEAVFEDIEHQNRKISASIENLTTSSSLQRKKSNVKSIKN